VPEVPGTDLLNSLFPAAYNRSGSAAPRHIRRAGETIMKTAVLSVLLLTVLARPVGTATSVAKPEDVGLSSERLQRVTQMIQQRIAAGDLAGAVTIVARKGRVAYLNSQGVMDLESKQPMTPATMFRIASMTKPVVGVAIMMMVEEGKLRLNDPVSRYIPEFANMKVAIATPVAGGRGAGAAGGATAPPQFYTVPAQRQITIKDLLSHVSGLGSGPMGTATSTKWRGRKARNWPTTSPAWVAPRSSSSRALAGRTALAPASKHWGASWRSFQGCRSTASCGRAYSMHWA
jgi:CubicO group peptidase (beta-lactamase class C family)